MKSLSQKKPIRYICLIFMFSYSLNSFAQFQKDSIPSTILLLTSTNDKEIIGQFISEDSISISLNCLSGGLKVQKRTISSREVLGAATKVLVIMENKDEYIGSLLSIDSQMLSIRIDLETEISLLSENIKSMEIYKYSGKFAYPNSQYTRHFVGPTAFTLEKGTGYWQNAYVANNVVNFGITDNFTLGGGLLVGGFITGYPAVYFMPKVGVKLRDKLYLAGGVIMAATEDGVDGLSYIVSTYGSHDANLTFGLGYGLGGLNTGNTPIIIASGSRRIYDDLALITENYIVTDGQYVGVHGIRLFGKRNSFDLGLMLLQNLESYSGGLPYLGYSRSF